METRMARGCGTRVAGGVYLTVPTAPGGRPVEDFLIDPPQAVDTEELGLSPVGVTLLEVGGVTHVLDWIGQEHYPNLADFVEECLPSGEQIITANGLSPIEEVALGDEVLTHRGRYRPVIGVQERSFDGQLLEISTPYLPRPLRLTPNHPIYRAKGLRGRKRRAAKGLCGQEILDRGFIPAELLEVGDYLCFPIARQEVDVRTITMGYTKVYAGTYGSVRTPALQAAAAEQWLLLGKRSYPKLGAALGVSKRIAERLANPPNWSHSIMVDVPVAEDLLTICGFYLAEGSVADTTQRGKENYYNLTEFSFGGTDQECSYAEAVVDAAVRLGFSASVSTRDGYFRAIISSRALSEFLALEFGKGASHKTIPLWVQQLPASKLRPLLDSYLKGDGHFRKGYWTANTVSSQLAHALRMIGLRLGYRPSIRCYAGGTAFGYSSRPIYRVAFFRGVGTDAFADDEYLYLPVQAIRHQEYHGQVHNIAVAEDESYCTWYHIVHNCRRLGVSRRIAATADFGKLTSQSCLFLVHAAAVITDPGPYFADRPEYTLPYKRQPYCPKNLPTHLDGREHCIALCWEDVRGAELLLDPDAHPRSAERVFPNEHGFAYRCARAPQGASPGYAPGIFARFPIARIEVVKDPDGGSHEKGLAKAGLAGIEVRLTDD